MMNFLVVVIALGFIITTFVSGMVIGFVLRMPTRIERIRKIRDEMMQEVDDAVDYYLGMHDRIGRQQR